MGLGRIEKLRNFLSSHPPLAVFIFCIGMTAVAFVSFAYYIKFNKVHNITIQKDWNTVLHNVTKLTFCSIQRVKVEETTSADLNDFENISIPLHALLFIPSLYQSKKSISHIISDVNASLLGFTGKFGNKSVHFLFSFEHPLSLSCTSDSGCARSIDSCVTIQAPRGVFPSTPKPEQCSLINNGTSPTLTLTGLSPGENGFPHECSNVSLKIVHDEDKRLFVYLSMHTKSIVHMHLIHSTYFLLLVILIILIFGLFRGGNQHHDKKSGIQHS